MTDEASIWFQYLKALGQSQGFLTFAQVNERLPHNIVDPEKLSEIVKQLEYFGFRVLQNSPAIGN